MLTILKSWGRLCYLIGRYENSTNPYWRRVLVRSVSLLQSTWADCLWRKTICSTKFWVSKGLLPAPAQLLRRHHGVGMEEEGEGATCCRDQHSLPKVLLLVFLLSPFLFFSSFMCISALSAGQYMHCMCAGCPWRPEEGTQSPKMELPMVGNHHVSVENWTRVYSKSTKWGLAVS